MVEKSKAETGISQEACAKHFRMYSMEGLSKKK
jgi:hypothetical protein